MPMQIFRALNHRNFRLFFAGQAISLLGIWMQGTAVSWLVWRLTHSTTWLGVIGFIAQIPILFFGLFGGVVADKVKRHNLVIFIQVAAMIQAVFLAAFTLSGTVSAPIIFILSLALGIVFSFDYPARQSFLMDMVGREDITNAVALNSSIVHGARVLGPVAAGFIVARWGEGTCFVVNAASFLFVIVALLMMRKLELYEQVISNNNSIKSAIIEIAGFVRKTPQVRAPLTFLGIFSLTGMIYIVLLPQIINVRFAGTARELGIAMGAAGLGALIGAVTLAMRRNPEGLQKVIRLCLGTAGIGIIIMSFVPTMALALPVLVLVGLSGFLIVASANTILQVSSPPDLRGRVMSVFTVAFFGLTPIGGLIAGVAASYIGVGPTLLTGGTICLAAAILARTGLINGSSTL